MTKIIQSYPNLQDNKHCLLACTRSVLSYYLPKTNFSDSEIDEKTLFNDGWTWLPPLAVWLDSLGLKIKLYSPFEYDRLANEGDSYLREFKKHAYDIEKANGSYNNLDEIRESCSQVISKDLWDRNRLDPNQLASILKSENTYAIGKTVYELLSGKPVPNNNLTSHYVLVIKEYNYSEWRVHDPGPPYNPERKIPKLYNGQNIFGDILVVESR